MNTFLVAVMCIIVVISLLYLLAIMPRMIGRADRTPFEKTLYAHRGLFDNETNAPENSMKAFKRAVDAGYGIELDVQLSKDKVPVVFHDFTLDRVCGIHGKVSEYTYEQLQEFTLAKSDERIPKFEDFLKLVDGNVPIIIEYKIEGTDVQVCVLGDKLLRNYKGVYCIESFNPMGVFWYRKNRKHIMRGQLSDSFLKDGEDGYPKVLFYMLHNLLFNFLTKPDFIAYNHKYYKDWSRRLCKNLYRGTAVAWTIKNEEELLDRIKYFDLLIFDSFIPSENAKNLVKSM